MFPKLTEDQIIDEFSQQKSFNDLFSFSVQLITHKIEQVILKLFSKQHHAKEFVIPSLLGDQGPLSETVIQAKLLYVLGMFSKEQYEDIEFILTATVKQVQTYEDFINIATQLNYVITPNHSVLDNKINSNNDLMISEQLRNSILQQRQTQLIRSSYILGIIDLINNLN